MYTCMKITATQKNLDICKSYHIKIVEPEIGELACGYQGRGHLSDIEDLLMLLNMRHILIH